MIASSLLGHVMQLLDLIGDGGKPADRVAGEYFRSRKYLGARDRRFISEMTFGILRHKKYIRTLIGEYARLHDSSGTLEAHPMLRLSEMAVYSAAVENSPFGAPLLWKTHLPNVDLDIFAEWVKANRLLPFLEGDRALWLSSYYSFPDWLVNDLMNASGDEIESLLGAMNRPAKTSLRVNTLKATRDECADRLKNEGVITRPSMISPDGLIAGKRFNVNAVSSFKEGWFEIQDEGSQLVSLIAGARPGMIIIDGCAGAGGKSLHMAALMRNEGEIISVDTVPGRLSELKTRASRAGATNIRTVLLSGSRLDDLSPRADIALVDAPCSGTGTIRRNPGLKWSLAETAVEKYAAKQKELLSFNSRFIKPGGKLVYVTCSLLRRENEDVAERFLTEEKDFVPETGENDFDYGGFSFRAPFVSLKPHLHDTDGFFIALMRRIAL